MTLDAARLAVVEGDVVRSRDLNAGAFTPARMFAVVVLWDAASPEWIGWLTMIDRESMCFGPADLADAELHSGWRVCPAGSRGG